MTVACGCSSIGIVTALLPFIGYANASQAAKTALETGQGVAEVVVELGYLNQAQVRAEQSLSRDLSAGRCLLTGVNGGRCKR